MHLTIGSLWSRTHRIRQWFGLDGTCKYLVQTLCHGQGCLSLAQVAQSSTQCVLLYYSFTVQSEKTVYVGDQLNSRLLSCLWWGKTAFCVPQKMFNATLTWIHLILVMWHWTNALTAKLSCTLGWSGLTSIWNPYACCASLCHLFTVVIHSGEASKHWDAWKAKLQRKQRKQGLEVDGVTACGFAAFKQVFPFLF